MKLSSHASFPTYTKLLNKPTMHAFPTSKATEDKTRHIAKVNMYSYLQQSNTATAQQFVKSNQSNKQSANHMQIIAISILLSGNISSIVRKVN